MFRNLITWPTNKMLIIMMEFKDYYGLFNIYGAIDGTHIMIIKSYETFV
jgi:hypothetical protein